MKMFLKFFDTLDRIEGWVICVLLAVMVILVAAGAINRFTLAAAMPWVDELVGFLFVWLSLVSAAVGITHKIHVGIDIITTHLPQKAQTHIERIVNLGGLVLCCIMFYVGMYLTVTQFHQLSTTMRVSMSWVYAALPVGWALMGIAFIGRIFRSFEKKEEPDA